MLAGPGPHPGPGFSTWVRAAALRTVILRSATGILCTVTP